MNTALQMMSDFYFFLATLSLSYWFDIIYLLEKLLSIIRLKIACTYGFSLNNDSHFMLSNEYI